jgi:hypothetical protein
VTPHGVDPAFSPGEVGERGYVLFVGAVQERKNPLAAADAARTVGLPLVVAGPVRDARLAEELERCGARLRGYVDDGELVQLYRGAACLVLPSRNEGFGLPALEASCGTPVVATPDRRCGGCRRRRRRPRQAGGRCGRRSPGETASRGRHRAPRVLVEETARAPSRSTGRCSHESGAVVVSHGHRAELRTSSRAGRRWTSRRSPTCRLGAGR